MQFDWAEMPTRPKVAGRERRVYALVASLPYSGAQTAFFSFEMTIESFVNASEEANDSHRSGDGLAATPDVWVEWPPSA